MKPFLMVCMLALTFCAIAEGSGDHHVHALRPCVLESYQGSECKSACSAQCSNYVKIISLLGNTRLDRQQKRARRIKLCPDVPGKAAGCVHHLLCPCANCVKDTKVCVKDPECDDAFSAVHAC